MIKKRSILAALLLLALLFSGCGGENGGGAPEETSSDQAKDPALVTFDDLQEAVTSALPGEFAPRDEEYLRNFLGLSSEDFAHCAILGSTDGSVDEVGIFEVKPGDDITAAQGVLRDYFGYRESILDDRYDAAERPKIERGEARAYGARYLLYVILSEEDKAAVLAAAGALLGE